MDRTPHNMSNLFAQLGINNSQTAIEHFISTHKGIPKDIPLAKADIWTQSQSDFLEQSIQEDADWAEIVDSLDSRLR